MSRLNEKLVRVIRRMPLMLMMLGLPILGNASEGVVVVKQIQGIVLVDHGDGFSITGTGAELRSGDRVMTAEGASALLVVETQGCRMRLAQNRMIAIQSPTDCEQLASREQHSGPRYAAAIGVFKTKPEPENEPQPAETQPEQPAATPAPAEPNEPAPQEAATESSPSPEQPSGNRIVDSLQDIPRPALWLGAGLVVATLALHSGGSSSTPPPLSQQ